LKIITKVTEMITATIKVKVEEVIRVACYY
jgi:hypothetical protein